MPNCELRPRSNSRRQTLFTTNPIQLNVLLDDVHSGKIQLPDFQRGWVWDDERIKDLLVSISRSFPVGAVMTLSADGDVQFQKRMIEGASDNGSTNLDRYLLDGQQRLTSLYQALVYPRAVTTRDRPGGSKVIKRWYYLDMKAALDPSADPEDLIVSVPENHLETRNFGREIILDLSSKELEFQQHMMPTERIMDNTAWGFEYAQYWNSSDEPHPHGNAFEFFMQFQNMVLNNFTSYQLPVINLDKDTSKEAVCTVFEKVNTGGVTLNVFELLTATLAADGFSLRDDWNERRNRMCTKFGMLQGVDGTNFLQAITLLATQQRQHEAPKDQAPPGIGCKRADILSLTLDEYKNWAHQVEEGFQNAAKFLHDQFVFTQPNIPYNTQLVPLAALHVELGHELDTLNAKNLLERWYWCGVFGEMYAGSVETQYARDLPEVANYIRNGTEPYLVREANFVPSRLIGLRTRLSAAYKGLYALQMKSNAADWRSGNQLVMAVWHNQNIDIHHIFPVRWCTQDSVPPVPKSLYDSIINKTPIDATTNRIIGGKAPSKYLPILEKGNNLIADILKSHWLDPEILQEDQFARSFAERGEAMLTLIGQAMGKPIAGGQEAFWEALRNAGLAEALQTVQSAGTQELIDAGDDDEDYDALGDEAYQEVMAADD